jgi:hypothetical protein
MIRFDPPRVLALAIAVIGVGVGGAACRAMAAPPGGYTIDSLQAAEERPTWRDAPDGDFTYSIRRDAAGPLEARLMGIAESCYPPRATLIEKAVAEGHEIGPDSAGASLWWADGTGVRRVPYAVTAGALWYYLGLTETLREPEVRVPGAPALFHSRFAYRGSVEPREIHRVGDREWRQVFVARLELEWSYDDGTFAPSITAWRTVVLTPEGQVLFVEGDGTAAERVAMSGHRGVGRVERRVR